MAFNFVPVIDIAPARAGDASATLAVAETIDAACRRSGFLVVSGHGVDEQVIDAMHETTLAFFELADDVKSQYEVPPGDPTLRGFYKTASYVAASEGVATAPDLVQLYTACRLGEPGVASSDSLGDHYSVWSRPNVWPAEVPGFAAAWADYYASMEVLSAELMRLFAVALKLDPSFFDDKIDDHVTNLVANYYPAIEGDVLPGQYRKGPHSDWGTLTVLYQDDVGGLEVLDRDTGAWINVPIVPGTFVVNIGDLMAMWTNDLWRSTKHRVRVPPPEERLKARVSIPFFHQPNWDALVECLPSAPVASEAGRYAPVTSGRYLLDKIQSAYN